MSSFSPSASRVLISALTATLFACGSPSSPGEGNASAHDFDLTVQMGEVMVRDDGPADSDP